MVSAAIAPAGSTVATTEPKKKHAVTIKDIAKIAGVHFTTVSLALRDHPSLLPSTKARIREIADKMGYVPNAVFSALTHFHLNGRVRAAAPRVAYLVNHPLEQGAALYRPQQQILEGAREQARALGYDLEVITVGVEGNESLRLDAFLKEQNITGVVLAAFDPGFAPVTLDWDEYSIVKIDSLHMDPPAPVVGSDHGRMCVWRSSVCERLGTAALDWRSAVPTRMPPSGSTPPATCSSRRRSPPRNASPSFSSPTTARSRRPVRCCGPGSSRTASMS